MSDSGSGTADVAHLLDLLPGPPVRLREDPGAFRVDEIPLIQPTGTGEHLFLNIEKKNASTVKLVKDLCQLYQLRDREVGIAGRKDERGVTTQWLSCPAVKVTDDGAALEKEGAYRVLQAKRNAKKLRLGQLKGNHFHVRVTSSLPTPVIDERLNVLAFKGCPNYFGSQRFGQGGESWHQACRFVRFRRRPKNRKEKFLVSVFQSALFNLWLHERITDGLLFSAIQGDVLTLRHSRSNFECENPDDDSLRVQTGDVIPSGPLWGAKMRPTCGIAMTRESRLFTKLAINDAELVSHPAFQLGDRRVSRIFPERCQVTQHSVEGEKTTETNVSFVLPKGSYATVLLMELFGGTISDAANEDPFLRPL